MKNLRAALTHNCCCGVLTDILVRETMALNKKAPLEAFTGEKSRKKQGLCCFITVLMLWMTLMDWAFTFFRQLKTTPGKREKMSHCKCFAYNSKNVDCAELSTCFYFHSLKQISILLHTKNPFFCYCTLLAIKLNSSAVRRNSFYCTTFAKSFQTDFFCQDGGKQNWVILENALYSQPLSLQLPLTRFMTEKSLLHICYLLLLLYSSSPLAASPSLPLCAGGNPGCDARSWCRSKAPTLLLRLWFRML